MPIELDRVEGYAPTPKELFEALGIKSFEEIRDAALGRCRSLYNDARAKNKIRNFDTKHDFIICKSEDFFPILTKLGYGSAAMVVYDDYGDESYFLMFEDKIPEKFYPVAAAHETTEYDLVVLEGEDRRSSHIKAYKAELKKAKDLHVRASYMTFLKNNYPEKYRDMRRLNKHSIQVVLKFLSP